VTSTCSWVIAKSSTPVTCGVASIAQTSEAPVGSEVCLHCAEDRVGAADVGRMDEAKELLQEPSLSDQPDVEPLM